MRYTRIIHEAVVMQSGQPIGKLENALVQFPFKNFEEVLAKANRYSTIGARMLAHKQISMWTALGHAIWAFIKHNVFKLDFRNGWVGFVIVFWKLRGHLLPLHEALRRNQSLAAAYRRAATEARTAR